MSDFSPMGTELRPLGKRLIVRQKAAETMTEGGIALPDASQEKPHEGVILAIGPECGQKVRVEMGERQPSGGYPMPGPFFQVGDTVLFAQFAGSAVEDNDGESLLCLHEDDLLCVRSESTSARGTEARDEQPASA